MYIAKMREATNRDGMVYAPEYERLWMGKLLNQSHHYRITSLDIGKTFNFDIWMLQLSN